MRQHAAPAAGEANRPKLVVAWGFVGIPFAWGVLVTVNNALALFK